MIGPLSYRTAVGAGAAVPQDVWQAAAASWAADSTPRCRPGGWRSASALCRAAIPGAGRIEAADGSCRPVVPALGAVEEARRIGRHAGLARDWAAAASVRRPVGARGRRP